MRDIRADGGFSYIAPIHHARLSFFKYTSAAQILEDEVPLPGPANALHEEIRRIGHGRYSFWHEHVYFSASDNTDPRSNGRRYEIAGSRRAGFKLAVWPFTIGARAKGTSPSPQMETAKPINFQNRSSSGDVLAKDVGYALEIGAGWIRLLGEAYESLDGRVVVEVGPGINFGSTLLLACLGARVMVADRFLAPWDVKYHLEFYSMLRDEIRVKYPVADLGPLDMILSRGDYVDEAIQRYACPLESLEGIGSSAVDVCLSNAVLEHLEEPRLAFRELARISKPSALGYHQVDFRDHKDFSKPLEYLLIDDRSFEVEFRHRHGEQGNRYRPAEYADLFAETGFRTLKFLPSCYAEDDYLAQFLPRLRSASGSRYQHEPADRLRVLSGLFCLERA